MKRKALAIPLLIASAFIFTACANNNYTEIDNLAFADVEGEQAVDTADTLKPEGNRQARESVSEPSEDIEPSTEELDITIDDTADDEAEMHYTGLPILRYDMEKYISLGTYKKMALVDPGIEDASIEKLNDRVARLFNNYSLSTYPVEDAVVEADSIVEISYTLNPDNANHGEYKQIAVAGSIYINENISNVLVGKKPGDSFETEVEDIETHQSIQVNGKIVAVRERYPYNNETIARVSNQKYQSEEAMVNQIFTDMIMEAQRKRYKALSGKIVEVLAGTSKVIEYPEEIMSMYVNDEKSMLASHTDITDEQIQERAKTMLFLDMMMTAILQKEGITISSSDYTAAEKEIRREYDAESPEAWEQFKKLHGDNYVERDTLYKKAINAVLSTAKLIK